MHTYSFEVTPWHATNVKRVLELAADHTVEELHLAIVRAFELDDRQPYAFFLNNELWDEEFAYGTPDGACHDARETRLAELALVPKKRFLYLSDFDEELTFEVRVQQAGIVREGERYPRVVEAIGDARPQYDVEEAAHADCHGADSSRPELVMLAYRIKPYVAAWDEEIERFAAQDTLEDDEEEEIGEESALLRSEARLLEELDAAMELLAKSKGNRHLIHVNIEHTLHMSPWPWLVDLPDRLDEAGHPEASVGIAERLLALMPIDPIIFRLPVYLARAGRTDEARERLEDNLENYPEESRMLLDAGDALVQLADEGRAETCYAAALTFAGATLPLRQGAMERLMMLLERQQRHAELEKLLRRELAIAEAKLRDPKPSLAS